MAHKYGKKKTGIVYIPGDSLIHRLDPRTKIFALVIVSIGALISDSLLIIGFMFAFVLAFAILSGLFGPWIHKMRILIPVILATVVIDVLFTSARNPFGGTIYSADIWLLHPEVTWGTIMFAASMGLRIMTIGGFSFLFVMTTPYSLFVKSLSLFGVPKTFAFSLGYALKSITSLSSDAGNILDAQKSRGLVFDRDLILKNPVKLLSVFVPMIVSVMNRSEQVSDAMQCRGYGLVSGVTVYRAPVMERIDYMVVSLSAAVLILNIFIAYNLTGF